MIAHNILWNCYIQTIRWEDLYGFLEKVTMILAVLFFLWSGQYCDSHLGN